MSLTETPARLIAIGGGGSFTFGGSEDTPIPDEISWFSTRAANLNLALGTFGEQLTFLASTQLDLNVVRQKIIISGEIRGTNYVKQLLQTFRVIGSWGQTVTLNGNGIFQTGVPVNYEVDYIKGTDDRFRYTIEIIFVNQNLGNIGPMKGP